MNNLALIRFFLEKLFLLWFLTFSFYITTLFGIPVKLIISLCICFLFLILIIIKDNLIIKNRYIYILISFIGILTASSIGLYNGFHLSTISHLSSTINSTIMVIIFILLCENNDINSIKFKNYLYFATFAGVLNKDIIGIIVISGYIDPQSIENFIKNFLGSPGYHIDMFGGFMGMLPRIGNAGDIYYLIVFLFFAKSQNGLKLFITWIAMALFVIISYSRYLMMVYLIITIYIVIYKISLKKMLILSLFIPFIFLYLSSETNILFTELYQRYTGDTRSESDGIRKEMFAVLSRNFLEQPFFGIGLGGFDNNYIRSDINKWQYELEYLSLLMQLGFIGFLLTIASYIIFIYKSIKYDIDKSKIFLSYISLGFLLATPFQSALIISTQFSLAIISIYALSRTQHLREPLIPPVSCGVGRAQCSNQ